MANVKALTWPAYYARIRDDGGAIQNLFQTNLGTLAAKSKSHLQNFGKFTETITDSAHGNMILVPRITTGKMQLIHHGFSCSTDDGFALVFAQGNSTNVPTSESLIEPTPSRRSKSSKGARSQPPTAPPLHPCSTSAQPPHSRTSLHRGMESFAKDQITSWSTETCSSWPTGRHSFRLELSLSR